MIGERANSKLDEGRSGEEARGHSARMLLAAAVRLSEIFTVTMLMLVSNRRAWYCFFLLDDRDYYCEYGTSTHDYVLWTLVAAGILLLLAYRGGSKQYLQSWRANRLLLIFMAFAALSLTWSIAPLRSLHVLFIMIAASVSASGLAILYSREQLLRILLWFIALAAASSLLAVIVLPRTAITQVDYLAGTWRGVYWHKNYLGSVMAFGNALFLLSFWKPARARFGLLLSVVFYLLSLYLLVMSRSATGLIEIILLNGLIVAYFAWLRWGKGVNRRSLVSLGGLAASLGLAVILNLGRLFALIGKSTGLTGRVPLWEWLLHEVVTKRPWLGYGMETLWPDGSFQIRAGKAVDWGMTILNSHSGYVDILIYLGAVGLILLCLFLAGALVRTVRCAFQEPGWGGLLPFLILTYVLVANITISYFLEFESWHWVLLVLVLFMTVSPPVPAMYGPEAAT